MGYKYSNTDLIKIIQDKAKEIGRTPKRREIKQFDAIKKRFGSFNNGLIKAGLRPLKQCNLTKEDYKNIIIEWSNINNKTPTIEEFCNDIYLPDPRTIERSLNKSWSNIMIELGLKPNLVKIKKRYNKDELINIFKEEFYKNKPTKQNEYDKLRTMNTPSIKYILNKLDLTWNELLKIIGVPDEDIRFMSITKRELEEKFKKLIKKLESIPSFPELRKLKFPCMVIRNKYGNYNNFLKALNIELNQKTPDVVTETDEELLNMYIEFSKKLGVSASRKELDKSEEIYNADVFIIRFGSMYDLKKVAGFKPIKHYIKYTKENIEVILLNEYNKKGRILTNKEISKIKDIPAVSTILRHFHTTKMSVVWKKILESKEDFLNE